MKENHTAYPEKQAAADLIAAVLRRAGVKQRELAHHLYLSPGALSRKLSPRYGECLSARELELLSDYLDLIPTHRETLRRAHLGIKPPDNDAVPTRHSSTTAIPVYLTSFVGREWETGALRRLLATTRLLTISGAGGCGKTRLAAAVATDLHSGFRDGVVWLSLAALTNDDQPLLVLAAALAITSSGGADLLSAVAETLQRRESLLVFDNCEHLIDAVSALVTALLAVCPALVVLATSREPLSIAGETVWRAPSLPTPPDPAVLAPAMGDGSVLLDYAAARLFVDRATAAGATFAFDEHEDAAIARICRQLDGLPLALELAAARTTALSVHELAATLQQGLGPLFTGLRGAAARQQTMEAAIAWSHTLLTADEQVLFRRLAVFAGGFDSEAMLAVMASLDDPDGTDGAYTKASRVLEGLVRQSLVQADTRRLRTRFRLLEPVRQFAWAQLTHSGELATTRQAHVRWISGFTQERGSKLHTPEQQIAISQIEADHDNIRAALAWSFAQGDIATVSGICTAIWRFWEIHGHIAEAVGWFQRLVTHGEQLPPRERSNAYNLAGNFSRMRGDYQGALGFFEQALPHAEAAGRTQSIAATLTNLGGAYWGLDRIAEARAAFERALVLTRETGEQVVTAQLLANLAMLMHRQGDWSESTVPLEKSLALFRALGDRWGEARVLMLLGSVAEAMDARVQVRSYLGASIAIYRELGDARGESWVLSGLGLLEWREGNTQAARTLLTTGLALARQLGNRGDQAATLTNLGWVTWSSNQPEEARTLFDEALVIRTELGNVSSLPEILEGLAACFSTTAPEHAAQLWGKALALRERFAIRPSPVNAPRLLALQERMIATLGRASFERALEQGRRSAAEA